MNRYVYISCSKEERNLPQVIRLCQWIMSNDCIYIFGNGCCHASEGEARFLFKRCAAFVAVAAYGYNNSSWLNAEFHEACFLSKSSPAHRPFLFGLSIDGSGLPRQGNLIHWLDLERSYLNAEQSYTDRLES